MLFTTIVVNSGGGVVDVLVNGAGIGGLALAAGLRSDGHPVTILERSPGPSTRGAAVTVFSDGMRAAADLGLDLTALGADIAALRLRRADGRPVMRTDLEPMRRRTGQPVRTVPRAGLVATLTGALDTGTVRYGAEVEQVRLDRGRPTVVLTSGETLTADLLVGADGHRSPTRRAVLDTDPAADAGWATWQGLGPVAPDVARGSIGELVVGAAGLVGLMPAGDGLTQWWFDTRWNRSDPADDPITMLRRRFSGYVDPVATLLDAVTGDDVGRYPHVVHTVHDRWGAGPVTLIGDAAHAFPPSQAQGANQTLEDAALLRRTVAEVTTHGDLEAALRRFEARRAAKVRRVSGLAASERTNRPPGAVLGTLARCTPARLNGYAYLRLLRSFSDVLSS